MNDDACMGEKHHVLRIGDSESGHIQLNVDELAETRLLITATSGGGKTGTVFKLCEQAVAQMQVIIIDRESEYAPLRQKFPFVLVGPDGDALPSVKTAALLAERLLELGASAILDLYEMKRADQHEFVRAFLIALVDEAPKRLWPANQNRLCMVVVDEAHLFMPENGEPSSVASEAVEALATRGRKRGLISVLATQRLASMSKNGAAMCMNTLVGLTSDIDEDRAAKQLRIGSREAKSLFIQTVARLRAGQFYAYGRAFGLQEATLFQVERAETLPEKKARKLLAPPPAPAAIRDLLPQLASLPQEAEKKAKTEAELRADLQTANRRVKELEAKPKESSVDEETVKMLKEKLGALSDSVDALQRVAEAQEARDERVRGLLGELQGLMASVGPSTAHATASKARGEAQKIVAAITPKTIATPHQRVAPKVVAARGSFDFSLPAGERKVLSVLAQYPEGLQRLQIGVFSGYVKRSTRDAYLQRLQTKGYVSQDGANVAITSEGIGAVGDYEPLPTGGELQEWWLAQLPKGEAEVLRVLCAKPSGLSREEIGQRTGYEARSTRDAYIQRLSAKLLVTSSGAMVRASEALFD